SDFVGDLFARADKLKDHITALPKTSSFEPAKLADKESAEPVGGLGSRAQKTDGPREQFKKHLEVLAAAEEKVRAEFGQLVGQKDLVLKRLKQGQFNQREADIRKEMAFLEQTRPGSTAPVAGQLDQAKAGLSLKGEPLTAAMMNKYLTQKEQELAAM